MRFKPLQAARRGHVTFNNCLPARAVPISPKLETCEAFADVSILCPLRRHPRGWIGTASKTP